MILIFLCYSCGAPQDSHNQASNIYSALKELLKTDHINILKENRSVKIEIEDSRLIDEAIEQKSTFFSYELYASIVSVLAISDFSSNDCDSILIDIKQHGVENSYDYSYKDIELVVNKYNACKLFCKAIQDGDFKKAKSYINKQILEQEGNEQVDQMFNDYFSLGQVEKFALTAFQIRDDRKYVMLVVNITYKGKGKQKYIFMYEFSDQSDDIYAISIP
ncbi:MAG: hypothetical protein H6550_14580 [Chitinophagales bacterium]|nr:hypothetical protein [Chitinophagales bacterium]